MTKETCWCGKGSHQYGDRSTCPKGGPQPFIPVVVEVRQRPDGVMGPMHTLCGDVLPENPARSIPRLTALRWDTSTRYALCAACVEADDELEASVQRAKAEA